MEDPTVIFYYQHQLSLELDVDDLQQLVQEYVVKDKKLWVGIEEALTEDTFLSLINPLEALIQRSRITHFQYVKLL